MMNVAAECSYNVRIFIYKTQDIHLLSIDMLREFTLRL